jgi:hypothetical protein
MEEYWEKRYTNGGTSGTGSIGLLREWKWQVIDRVVGRPGSVVDVCCGDLTFWENRDCENYTGIDVSSAVIERDRKARPSWSFVCAPAEIRQDIKGEVVFCMDALFHVMDDDKYDRIVMNLACYSTRWIVVSTWYDNPLAMRRMHVVGALLAQGRVGPALRFAFSDSTTDFLYQKYRAFEGILEMFKARGFGLVHSARMPPSHGLYFFSSNEEDSRKARIPSAQS